MFIISVFKFLRRNFRVLSFATFQVVLGCLVLYCMLRLADLDYLEGRVTRLSGDLRQAERKLNLAEEHLASVSQVAHLTGETVTRLAENDASRSAADVLRKERIAKAVKALQEAADALAADSQ